MKTLRPNLLKTIAVLLLFVTATQAQNTIIIDNGPQSTTQYTTIQAAIDAASDGDIIYVQPSATSYGSATINKPLTIIGRSHSEPSEVSNLTSVIVQADNVTIKGLSFSSCYASYSGSNTSNTKIYECKFSTLYLAYAGGIADDVTVRGCYFNSFNQYATATNVLISNNIIRSGGSIDNPTNIIVANNIFKHTSNMSFSNNAAAQTAIIYNNMFINNSANNRTITFSGVGDWNISNNLIYNYGTGDFTLNHTGTGTFEHNGSLINTDPLFTNVDSTVSTSFAGTSTYNPAARPEDDLTLQASSPALTGGGGGSELGIFNNGFNFKYLGNPRGIPTFDIVTYTGAVPKNGNINVTVEAKAH
ncbi:hypothetical protein IA57_06035 [Mangrovimonas yunxiaonensis]|uniref:Right handed beta helix domain-containing protein n=1 Tax=Mangrovimonas yunxiaonensis TaxID=1197477 RepID=A0A084TKZ8_9FLAO|nr:hypothetical protein [Mangrovimonas yunxiaonensis]KFB01384.1 hypothetical protein IA57_06035 [Mangrovimonas yunxiaonensis]GGH36988.1 hypothetical protein GCM10011364_04660 [Mangrovimonas yunxiaonensis]